MIKNHTEQYIKQQKNDSICNLFHFLAGNHFCHRHFFVRVITTAIQKLLKNIGNILIQQLPLRALTNVLNKAFSNTLNRLNLFSELAA